MTLVPVFVGSTATGEEIVLYKKISPADPVPGIVIGSGPEGVPGEYHLKLPDGEVWALEPGADIAWWMDAAWDHHNIDIRSSVWTGQARGSKQQLVEALEAKD